MIIIDTHLLLATHVMKRSRIFLPKRSSMLLLTDMCNAIVRWYLKLDDVKSQFALGERKKLDRR